MAKEKILVVDDDSADRTWEKAQTTPGLDPSHLRVIRREGDHGLTASLREGIRAARHDVVVWMDCDFSHPPAKIPQMLYMLDEGYDVVANPRYARGGGEDRIGNHAALLDWRIRIINEHDHVALAVDPVHYV